MPVQHGSDKIQKKMRRGVNTNGINKRIDMQLSPANAGGINLEREDVFTSFFISAGTYHPFTPVDNCFASSLTLLSDAFLSQSLTSSVS